MGNLPTNFPSNMAAAPVTLNITPKADPYCDQTGCSDSWQATGTEGCQHMFSRTKVLCVYTRAA